MSKNTPRFANVLEIPDTTQGVALTTPEGVASTNGTFPVPQAYGDVIGISVPPNYSDTVLSKIKLSVDQGSSSVPFDSVPLSLLKVTTDRLYYPLPMPFKPGTVNFKLVSTDETVTNSNPVTICLHYRK